MNHKKLTANQSLMCSAWATAFWEVAQRWDGLPRPVEKRPWLELSEIEYAADKAAVEGDVITVVDKAERWKEEWLKAIRECAS
jgi:hypothetical protein